MDEQNQERDQLIDRVIQFHSDLKDILAGKGRVHRETLVKQYQQLLDAAEEARLGRPLPVSRLSWALEKGKPKLKKKEAAATVYLMTGQLLQWLRSE